MSRPRAGTRAWASSQRPPNTCHAGFFLERVGGALEAHRGEGLQHEMEELDAVRAEHGVRRWFHFVFFFKFFKDFFFYARHSMH